MRNGRKLTTRESLCKRILKGKYFHNSDFTRPGVLAGSHKNITVAGQFIATRLQIQLFDRQFSQPGIRFAALGK
jgi:hypothetical protein